MERWQGRHHRQESKFRKSAKVKGYDRLKITAMCGCSKETGEQISTTLDPLSSDNLWFPVHFFNALNRRKLQNNFKQCLILNK